jgi:predicted RND superfamily exporter protein
MTRFREVLGRGLSVEEAVVEAMRTVGRAILFNAVVVVAGFAVLGFSSAPSNVIFGGLVALNMATSALGALLLLPALLAVDGHRRAAKGPTKKAPWLRDAA